VEKWLGDPTTNHGVIVTMDGVDGTGLDEELGSMRLLLSGTASSALKSSNAHKGPGFSSTLGLSVALNQIAPELMACFGGTDNLGYDANNPTRVVVADT
jgi:hypothetical protein